MIALLFAGALRRSEIAGLDYDQAGDGDGYLALSDVAVEIVLLRSKARTEPVAVLVPQEHNPGPIAALERWIAVAGEDSRELGMARSSVYRLLQEAAARRN